MSWEAGLAGVTVAVFVPPGPLLERIAHVAGRVVPADPATGPARALALLERERAGAAVLPAALAAALGAHPARALTDLGALRHLACTGDGGLPDLPGVTVLRLPDEVTGSGEEAGPRDATDPAAAAARAGDAAIADLDPATVGAAAAALDRAALLALRRALDLPARPEEILDRAGPAHAALVGRWIAALDAAGVLATGADGCRHAPPVTDAEHDAAWDAAEQAWAATRPPTGDVATVRYARRCAETLPGLLAGEISALGLLFPDGRHDVAAAVYREPVVARYQLAAAGALVAALRPRRLLEVGAGTGATTDAVVAALGGTDELDLLVTDLSPAFLDGIRRRHPGVRTARLDLDRPLAEQGVAPGSRDAVVAGGALNAVADTDRTLAELAGVLAPGGVLVLTEPTREEPWVLLTQGFLLGAAGDDPARAGATFLDHEGWRAALARVPGLEPLADLPGPGHVLTGAGHRLFAMRRTPGGTR